MEVNIDNIDEEINDSEKPVFALFWASWCTACKRSEVTVSEIEEERDDIKVIEANVDKNMGLRDKFDIKGVPTFITFNGGEEVDRKVGAQGKRQLTKMIDEVVNK
ncbi:MAG: thioredoxin family protein [Candidatus Thermoplasmatota archaeon]|nr:thioredoxin family protein [Candidatus Thermoplasmatota archaeon]